MKRLFLFLAVILSLSLTTQKANSRNEHGPFHAFSVFPLKGTVVLSSVVSSKSSYKKSKYKFSRQYELICKANTLVVNYPPRGDGNGDTMTITMVLFDPWVISRYKGAQSENYASGDVQCGSYWIYYPHFARKGYNFIGNAQFPKYQPAKELREFIKDENNSYFYKKRWCRFPVLGFKADFLYYSAIVDVYNKNLVYWTYSEMHMCTNSWWVVKKWQKEGWYLIK